jgi:hypothetical protein
VRTSWFLVLAAFLGILSGVANAQPTQGAVPPNASVDITGRGWTCNEGFVRRASACVSLAAATDSEIRQVLIAASIRSYPGSCPCPYNSDRAGRSCGRRSAYSRPGGQSPRCYEADISDDEVRRIREKYKSRPANPGAREGAA